MTAITFHGGTNVIGYPWGSNNHILKKMGYTGIANEAPDHVALDTLGKAMFFAANSENIFVGGGYIPPYILGDMTSTVYPVGGGMEDWGYGAGFDTAPDARIDKCTPATKPKLADSFFETQENVRCAVYLIEADDNKNPLDNTFGSREIVKMADNEEDYQVLRSSVEDREKSSGYDGHINRNIRLAMAMIDMSKPYI